MADIFGKYFSKNSGKEETLDIPAYHNNSVGNPEVEIGNMNQLGYIRAGRNNGDPVALNSSFQLIRSGKIVDEGNNQQKKNAKIDTLDKEIISLRDKIGNLKAEIEKIDQIDIPQVEAEIESNKADIARIQSVIRSNKFQRNRFNTILLWAGFILGFIYLYLFYVSAIHSALFRNIAAEVAKANTNNIGNLLNNVFNISAFKEFNIHWIAPVVFMIFAVILHLTLEIKAKAKKIVSVSGVVIFVLLADGLLAYYIEKNNHFLSQLMGFSNDTWAFYKSSGFYLVLFFGFFTSIGWSLILHKLAGEFEAGNPERKAADEISAIEKKIRQLIYDRSKSVESRIANSNSINSIEQQIKSLEDSKSNIHYSVIDLENNIDDFYNGWLSYLNGLKSDSLKKQECEKVYLTFKSELSGK